MNYRVNVILGRTGSGKSRLMTRLLRDHPKLLIVDTMREHSQIAPEMALDDARSLLLGGTTTFRASLIPVDEGDVDWICQLVASQVDIALAIDEYAAWYPSAHVRPSDSLMLLVRCGRKLGQHVFITTQTPGSITKQITSQAAVWILEIQEPNGIKYILDRTGGQVDPSTLGPIEIVDGRAVKVKVALFADGKRRDFVLDTRIPELHEVDAEIPAGETREHDEESSPPPERAGIPDPPPDDTPLLS